MLSHPSATLDDEAWLRGLIDEHTAVLRRIAMTQLGPDGADDVVSETFAAAWQDRAQFDPTIANERAWLAGIAINRCRALGRAQRRWRRRADRDAILQIDLDDFVDDANARVDARQLRAKLLRHLGQLPEAQRTVLALVAGAGLEPSEVAAALEMPAATVRVQLMRARHSITQALDLEAHNE